tara:strand:+ start:21 stop:200 length:180 start_codon:yes stop_codon:yes gene_type:complete
MNKKEIDKLNQVQQTLQDVMHNVQCDNDLVDELDEAYQLIEEVKKNLKIEVTKLKFRGI